MVSRINSAEGVATGTIVTGANSAISGDAFQQFSGSPRYSDEWSAFGSQSFKFSGTALPADLLRWEVADPELRFAGYMRLPSLPGATCALAHFRHGSGNAASLQMSTAGVLQFLDTASTGTTSLMTYTAGVGVFVTGRAKRGTTTSNGEMQIEVRSLDGATLLGSYSNTARNLGTADLASVQFGRLTAAASATVYWDQVRVESGAGDLIAPWVPPEEPTVPLPGRWWNGTAYVEVALVRWNGTGYVFVDEP